jgi:hypothetical protein
MLSTIPEATFHDTVNATITFEEADPPNTEAEKRKIAPTGFSGSSINAVGSCFALFIALLIIHLSNKANNSRMPDLL